MLETGRRRETLAGLGGRLERRVVDADAAGSRGAHRSDQPDARIEQRVEDIGEEIGDSPDDGHQQDQRQDHRVVPGQGRRHEEATKSGDAEVCSMKIDPVRMFGISGIMIVTNGIRALRATCQSSTRRSASPLARAVRTWSAPRLSSMLTRV